MNTSRIPLTVPFPWSLRTVVCLIEKVRIGVAKDFEGTSRMRSFGLLSSGLVESLYHGSLALAMTFRHSKYFLLFDKHYQTPVLSIKAWNSRIRYEVIYIFATETINSYVLLIMKKPQRQAGRPWSCH